MTGKNKGPCAVVNCDKNNTRLCYSQLHFDCSHCTEYYKKGIFNNVNSFISTLTDDKNITIEDTINNDELEETNDSEIDEELEIEQNNVTVEYLAAINAISEW